MTISEELFEQFCRTASIPYSRVAEEAALRRPDYEIALSGHRVVVEVKQFDPNDREAAALRGWREREAIALRTIVGDRIRKAIQRAAPQLRALSQGKRPALLVVWDNTMAEHTDPHSVATAMQGRDVIDVLVPQDPKIPPVFLDTRSGPGKKMTANDNTTISAIGVLLEDKNAIPHLRVYHNRHAANPIDPLWLRVDRVLHFRIRDGATNSLDPWEAA